MTDDEFNEKYKDVEVRFTHYWKYVFYFAGNGPDGEVVQVGYGGDSDQIYRYEVAVASREKINHWDSWSEIKVLKDGLTLYSKFNY